MSVRDFMLRDFRLSLPNPGFANPPWSQARFRVLIVRLSPFKDVERSTPHLVLFRSVREALPDAFIDMAFLPVDHDVEILRAAGEPLLRGTQSRRPAAAFDLVMVSNSWLLEQVNLPWLLEGSDIPVWASRRGEEHPPILVGGSNASAAHAFVSLTGDCMADALFFGEGETAAGTIARLWRENAGTGTKRERLLRIATAVPGLRVSGDPAAVVVRSVADMPASPAGSPVLPGAEAATARLPITAGCPCQCSFCFEGWDRRPFREVPVEEVLRAARELKMATGADTVEIESFNFNTHTRIDEILIGLNMLFHRVNAMSQRVDILARTPGLLELELAADKRSFTLGVEGVSAGMRKLLHKSLTATEVHDVLVGLHSHRIREIKLFYILTGLETDEDLDDFSASVKDLRAIRVRAVSQPRIVFSFGLLVRMPGTPLRHDPALLDESAWRQLSGRVKSICETHGFEFRLALPWMDYAATQVLAAGGPELSPLLLEMARAGSVTDRGLGPVAAAAVSRWIESHRAALSAEKPEDHPFAFPFLETAAGRARLRAAYDAARARRDDGYCRHGAPGPGTCTACTGCTRSPRKTTTARRDMNAAARRLAALMDTKHHLRPLRARARVPREAAGLGGEWIGSFLMRSLLAAHPEQTENALSLREALVGPGGIVPDDVPWFGDTLVDIVAWDTASLAAALAGAGAGGGPGHPWPVADPDAAPPLMRARVTLPDDLFPDPAGRLAAFLRDAHAPVTLAGRGGLIHLDVPEKSLKKKILRGGTCARTDGGHVLELELGQRPFLGEWLASFAGAETARCALVELQTEA